MKLFSILAVIVLLSTTYALEEIELSKRALACESIFSVKVCDQFRSAGKAVQLNAEQIENFVLDAYNKGITKATDVKNYVESELEKRILSKSCEELTGKTFCEKLDAVSKYLNKKVDDLKPLIAKAILEGKEKANEIADRVTDYIKNDLMQKECDDILTADQCKKITDIGNALTLKATQIKEAVVESVLRGFNNVRDTVTQTLTNLKKKAEAFTCEELLNPDVCGNIRHYANKFKIAMPKMMNAVRSAIIMGYKGTKGFITVVYKIADAFIDCEHFLSHENCESIKKTASQIGAKITEISVAIKDAVEKGITEAEKIYKNALNFLKSKFGRKRRSLLDKADLKAKLEKYKELLKTRLQQAKELMNKLVEDLMAKYKVVDEKIREVLKKAIENGKVKYNEIKDYVKELIEKKNNGLQITKREVSLREGLQKALAKATGVTKALIKKLLGYTNEKLQKFKRYIQSIVDSVLGETKRDVESEVMDETSENIVTAKFSELADKLNDEIEKAVNDISDETHDLIHEVVNSEHKLHKRFLDFDLKDMNIAEYVTKALQEKLSGLEAKIADKSSELLKDIKEALKKAGDKMTDVAKVIKDKIDEYLEKIKSE